EEGFDITFLTYGTKSDLDYSKLLDKIDVIPIKHFLKKKKIGFFKTLLFPLFHYNLFKNTKLIKTNQMYGGWITWILKILFRKKLVIRCGYELYKNTVHEYKNLTSYRTSYLRLVFIYLVELISYKIANHIIISNKAEKNFIIKHFKINPKKITVIPNIIDVDIFRPLNIKKKRNSVLYIGRLNEYKNLYNLIEAFTYLKDFTLDIIGKGESEKELKEKVKDLNLKSRVKFLGIIPNFKLPEIINQHEMFVLVSNMEGNPKVLLEAMSCGVACIGSDIPGINQIINHKRNGYLCGLDSKSISKAIKFVRENDEFMKSIGKNARDDIIKHNTLSKILGQEINIYKTILKKNK
ncbi:MAG: glycosyltransferase family 4 protein, partial [Candidatus Lokiarchaeota archaeon]|nr:glycosyltransferase family 4 protein [Candidatus Lokiarchaeota archaeon]